MGLNEPADTGAVWEGVVTESCTDTFWAQVIDLRENEDAMVEFPLTEQRRAWVAPGARFHWVIAGTSAAILPPSAGDPSQARAKALFLHAAMQDDPAEVGDDPADTCIACGHGEDQHVLDLPEGVRRCRLPRCGCAQRGTTTAPGQPSPCGCDHPEARCWETNCQCGCNDPDYVSSAGDR